MASQQASGKSVQGDVANVLRRVLESPNVADSNGEPANVVDVLHWLARAVGNLAEANAGGMEAIALAITNAGQAVQAGLEEVATELALALSQGGAS